MAVYRGDTITFERQIKDEDGQLQDPDTHSIKVYDPSGTQSGAEMTSPTKISLGLFRQKWTVPSDATYGIWRCEWKVTKGTTDKVMVVFFDVEEKTKA